MIFFRVLVLDPTKAGPLLDPEIDPNLNPTLTPALSIISTVNGKLINPS